MYTHITMALDETDLYQYVGAVDYIFVGVVQEANTNITEDNDKSTYKIEVTDNLKGELADEIECSKHGGILKDGTCFCMSLTIFKMSGYQRLEALIYHGLCSTRWQLIII